MAGLIDKEAELARLERETEKLAKDLARIQGKLNNAAFVDKAPATVVEKERDKMQAQQQALEKLQEQAQRIRQM
jgi:valyl-tRNA synthetase